MNRFEFTLNFGNIVSSVDRVKMMINEINVAAREQSTGIAQINQAISNLDGMTQQNAALVEEAAAAASSLNDQANSLSHVVDRFTV